MPTLEDVLSYLDPQFASASPEAKAKVLNELKGNPEKIDQVLSYLDPQYAQAPREQKIKVLKAISDVSLPEKIVRALIAGVGETAETAGKIVKNLTKWYWEDLKGGKNVPTPISDFLIQQGQKIKEFGKPSQYKDVYDFTGSSVVESIPSVIATLPIGGPVGRGAATAVKALPKVGQSGLLRAIAENVGFGAVYSGEQMLAGNYRPEEAVKQGLLDALIGGGVYGVGKLIGKGLSKFERVKTEEPVKVGKIEELAGIGPKVEPEIAVTLPEVEVKAEKGKLEEIAKEVTKETGENAIQDKIDDLAKTIKGEVSKGGLTLDVEKILGEKPLFKQAEVKPEVKQEVKPEIESEIKPEAQLVIPEGLEPLIQEAKKYKSAEEFVSALKDKKFTPNIKIDELGFIEIKKKVPIEQLEVKEKYPDYPLREKIEEYKKLPLETMPPIQAFGPRFPGDTYQVYNGHHRLAVAKEKGLKEIEAWITPVTKEGKPIRLVDIYNIAKGELEVKPEIKQETQVKVEPEIKPEVKPESLAEKTEPEVSKISEKTQPEIKPVAFGEGWLLLPEKNNRFRVAFEEGDTGELLRDALQNEIESLKGATGPKMYRIEKATGPIEYAWTPSSFPEWFKNKGYDKETAIKALTKALNGDPLGKREAQIVQDALNSKEVKNYIKAILSWGGEPLVELQAGIPVPKYLKQSFEALEKLKSDLTEKLAEKGHYKLADVLGYGKEYEAPDLRGLKGALGGKVANIELLSRIYGKHYPEIQQIEEAMKWIREPKANEWASRVDEILDQVKKLPKEKQERVFKILQKESFTGEPLDKFVAKLSPEEQQVYQTIRTELKNIWNDVKQSYKETLEKYIEAKRGLTKEEKEALKQALEKADPNLIPEGLAPKVPQFVHYLQRYSELQGVPYYFPQKRSGWMLRIRDPETGEVVFARDFATRSEAVQALKKYQAGDDSVIAEWYQKLGLPYQKGMFKGPAEVVEIQPLDYNLVEGMALSKAIAFLHETAKKTKGEADLEKFYETLAEDLDTFLKSLGWSSHLIRRKNIPGFSLETERALENLERYLKGYGLSKAKKESMEQAYSAFYKLVNRPTGQRPTELINWLDDYLRYSFGNPEPRAVQEASKGISLFYLGGNLKSALINATQNLTSGLAAYIHNDIPAKQLLKGLYYVTSKKMPAELEQALAKAIKEGFLETKQLNEMLSRWRSGDTLSDIALLPFRYVESIINRASHFLGAFDYLRNVKGLPFDEAYKKALEIMYEGHFWASRYNRAPIERGTIGRLATTLQTFTYHYLRRIFQYWKEGDWKAVAWLVASPVILGGAVAVPGEELIYEHVLKPALEKLSGENLDVKALEDKKWAFAKYGPMGLISPSLSRSVGVGFSEDPMRWIGGPIQGMLDQVKKAKALADRGDTASAVIELLPPALRNVFKAVMKENLETYKGEPISPEKEKLTPYERIMKAFGLNTPEIQRELDKRGLLKDMQEKRKEVVQKFVYQFDMALRKNDQEKFNELIKELQEHNQKMAERMKKALEKDNKVMAYYYGAMIIDPEDIRRGIRMRREPYKGVKKELRYVGALQ